jgi:hypothetical protein
MLIDSHLFWGLSNAPNLPLSHNPPHDHGSICPYLLPDAAAFLIQPAAAVASHMREASLVAVAFAFATPWGWTDARMKTIVTSDSSFAPCFNWSRCGENARGGGKDGNGKNDSVLHFGFGESVLSIGIKWWLRKFILQSALRDVLINLTVLLCWLGTETPIYTLLMLINNKCIGVVGQKW